MQGGSCRQETLHKLSGHLAWCRQQQTAWKPYFEQGGRGEQTRMSSYLHIDTQAPTFTLRKAAVHTCTHTQRGTHTQTHIISTEKAHIKIMCILYSTVCIFYIFFIHSSAVGHISWFQNLPTVSSPAVKYQCSSIFIMLTWTLLP